MTIRGPIPVMFAIPELDRGGPDRVVFEILTNLDRRRFSPAVMVCRSGGHYFSRLPDDLQVIVLSGGRYPALAALHTVRAHTPRVVFATQRMILTLAAVAPALPRATRIVLRQANDVSADFSALVRQSLVKHRLARRMLLGALRRADAVVCQSDAMRRDLQQLLGTRGRLHVIGNPVDVDHVAEAAPASVPGRPALVSVGRLAPQKGFDLLLPAIAALRADAQALHLTIYGDGPDRSALEAQARSLHLEDAVTFAGATPAPPLAQLRGADLFVLASRYEGFPNAALEALACGTPVVLTDCPGANAEIVLPGVNGRLAALEPTSICAAMKAALADRYDRAEIQRSTRARYALTHIVAEYERLIAEVAA